jgi:hypothetical protein
MKILLASICLSLGACSAFYSPLPDDAYVWFNVPQVVPKQPTFVQVSQAEVQQACGHESQFVFACALPALDVQTPCRVLHNVKLSAQLQAHETRHCMGENHRLKGV